MADILFQRDEWVFSYRVAGICVRDGKVLLQTAVGDTAYAFPGGHVEFGETNAQTLIREFREELGADITVGELQWVAEAFFPWGDKPCHQICLYYRVELADQTVSAREGHLVFRWVPLEEVGSLEVYPTRTPELLLRLGEGVQHLVYHE